MDIDIDPKILEEIRKLSLSSDVKFNRFFSDLTPETQNVLETIIRHYIPGVKRIRSMTVQKHAFHDKGGGLIADIAMEMMNGETIWVEMQNWNGKKEEVKYSRWEHERNLQLKKSKEKGCYLLVLLNTNESEGKRKIWDGFRDIESIRYSMKPDHHEREMDEKIFPGEADGVIMILNMERLSRRKNTLGDIFHDLLVPGNVELKNRDMEKRRKEVFTEEEEIAMCYEEQKMHERLLDAALEKHRIKDIKFMHSLGASAEEISKGIDIPLNKVKKILEME